MRFKTKSKDVLYKKTGIAKPDAKTLMLDAVGMLPTLMGAPISTTKALQQLGKSAVKVGKIESLLKGRARKIKPVNVRSMAADIRRSPKEALSPLLDIRYKTPKNPRTLGSNPRYGGVFSGIQLSPKADIDTWFHELTHASSYANRGDRSLKGYLSSLLESSSIKADTAVERAKKLGKIRKGDKYYSDMPIEQHARGVSEGLTGSAELGRNITSKDFDALFNREAKYVMKDLKKDWPELYKKTLKDTAKEYKGRAAVSKKLKEGKLPETFDEWMESITVSPKSKKLPTKKSKIKKKLTPGEIARALQDAAEAKGPLRYMRRKAD